MKKHLLGRFVSEQDVERPSKKPKMPTTLYLSINPNQNLVKMEEDEDSDTSESLEEEKISSSIDEDDNSALSEQMDERGWDSKYGLLREFKREYGHCNVSRQDTQWRALTWWVPNQRTARRKGLLSRERIRLLDSLDFEWDRSGKGCENAWNLYWNKQYEQLKVFKQKHGHLDVPRREERYKSLGWWVYNMRQMKKKGKMSNERIKKLDEIGFEWERVAKRGRKSKKDPLRSNGQNIQSPKEESAAVLAALCTEELNHNSSVKSKLSPFDVIDEWEK